MLEIRDLFRRFDDVVALDGLSMTVHPGRIHGFVGRNGAGKTTTMRIVLGLLDADRGSVTWRGRPLTPDDRRRIGYLPEERGLYPKMGALRQVRLFGELSGMGRDEAQRSAEHWLDALGLAERRNDTAETLSLGNQQRVQLATALVPRPELLVLDEPFSGLDPVSVDTVSQVLVGEVARGAAVVFSSHQLDLVERLCDSVTIVEEGRVVADGPIRDLRDQGRRRLVRVELEGGWVQWADTVPGSSLVSKDDGVVVLELAEGADDQAVLDAARAAGRVLAFERVRPSLTDLFREVVRS